MDTTTIIEKSLFFTGAGFSQGAGCKMSSEMLTCLEKIICNDNSHFTEIENETIKFLFSCLEYHAKWRSLENHNKYPVATNIEELALLVRRIKNRENFLPYPVTGNWADKLVFLETKYKETESAITGYSLFEKIEYTLKNKLLGEWLKVSDTSFLDPLDDFLEKNSSHKFLLELFSLNNDLVIEEHFSSKKITPYRGFCSGEWRGMNENPHPNEDNRINLYKLHGSLDWIRNFDGSVKEKDKFLNNDNNNSEIEHDPFIIFGHGSKIFSIEPFFSLIHNFYESLKSKSYYFVIGYSFFDPYINNLLFNAIMESPNGNKKLIIVNPFFAKGPLKENHFKIHPDFGKILNDNDREAKVILTNYLEDIQRNSFYSELPEFNMRQIPSESIYYLNINTEEFLKKYFENSGKLFATLLEYFESVHIKDLPFTADNIQ